MTTSIVVLAVVIVALLAVIAGLGIAMSSRRKKLQERFGPEYDRLVAQSDSRRLAEAEMAERERRVRKLDLRELSDAARDQYRAQWAGVQERFVEDPDIAIADAQHLVESVMRDRGYPAAEYHQTLADLSVTHAQLLDHVRHAHDVSEKAAAGQASTEELRVAMLHYRELFRELLAGETQEPVPPRSTPVRMPEPVHAPYDEVLVVQDADVEDPAADDAESEERQPDTAGQARR